MTLGLGLNLGLGLAPLVGEPPSSAPDAFGAGDWNVADSTVNGEVDVTISVLPTGTLDIEYSLDAGAWVSAGTALGFSIAGLTPDVEVAVRIRAVNLIGASDPSDTKTVTPVDDIPSGSPTGLLLAITIA
jgi:hypothetical protein